MTLRGKVQRHACLLLTPFGKLTGPPVDLAPKTLQLFRSGDL